MKRNDGGPAFPRSAFADADTYDNGTPGMTLRDYFAGQALQGLLAGLRSDYYVDAQFHDAAHDAYLWADAMLRVRERGDG